MDLLLLGEGSFVCGGEDYTWPLQWTCSGILAFNFQVCFWRTLCGHLSCTSSSCKLRTNFELHGGRWWDCKMRKWVEAQARIHIDLGGQWCWHGRLWAQWSRCHWLLPVAMPAPIVLACTAGCSLCGLLHLSLPPTSALTSLLMCIAFSAFYYNNDLSINCRASSCKSNSGIQLRLMEGQWKP